MCWCSSIIEQNDIDSVFKLFSPYFKNLHFVLFIVVLCVDITQRNYVHSFPKHKEKQGKIKSNRREVNEMTPFPEHFKSVNVCREDLYV